MVWYPSPMLERITVIIPTMEGVTTAIVLLIFAGVAWPSLIKNKTQFYVAFAALLLIILLFTLDVMIRTPGFQVFAGVLTGLLQLLAILMLFLCAGGMSLRQLTGEFARAYEVS